MKNPGVHMLIDECNGIYIPKAFYDRFDFPTWGLSVSDYTELSDTYNELYWEVWDELLQNAWMSEEYDESGWIVDWSLHQDGSLWAIPHKATNKWTGECVEFEHTEFFGE